MSRLEELLPRFKNAKKNGVGWQATCPAHDDDSPSLSIRAGHDGRLLLKCHAGCETQTIVAAAGITMADLFDEPGSNGIGNGKRPHVIAEYHYVDETGAHLFDVLRYEPKDFRQRAASGEWSMKGVCRVPYRLPQVLAGIAVGRHVMIVEGEKDVDALHQLGFISTTNAGGASKWRAEYNEHFRGAHVVILPDNDGPGRDHARDVGRHLFSIARSLRIVEIPNLPAKGDVSDWLSAGGTADELKALVRNTPALTSAPATILQPHVAETPTRGAERIARPIVVCLADVTAERVEWLAPAILPRKKFVIVEGDPGTSKSTLLLDLFARVTRGQSVLGAERREPQNVVLVTYEDGLADTVRPRIDALGGDPARVFVFRAVAVDEAGNERQPTFPDDVDLLQQIIHEHRAVLVGVDPLGAALSEDTDSHKDASVRRVTARLAKLAEDTGACIVGIRHLIKGTAANAMRAGGGSIAFVASARVAMLVSEHPDDSEKSQHERRRVFACVKNNLAPHPPSRMFELSQPDGLEHATIRWLGETSLSADDLNAAHAVVAPEERDAATERADWLREVLSDGPVDSKDVFKLARDARYPERTLRHTARAIGVQMRREGIGRSHRTLWELPSELPTPATPATTARHEKVAGVAGVGSDKPDVLTDAVGNQVLTAAGKARLRAERDANAIRAHANVVTRIL